MGCGRHDARQPCPAEIKRFDKHARYCQSPAFFSSRLFTAAPDANLASLAGSLAISFDEFILWPRVDRRDESMGVYRLDGKLCSVHLGRCGDSKACYRRFAEEGSPRSIRSLCIITIFDYIENNAIESVWKCIDKRAYVWRKLLSSRAIVQQQRVKILDSRTDNVLSQVKSSLLDKDRLVRIYIGSYIENNVMVEAI